jgi:hypothetical protein
MKKILTCAIMALLVGGSAVALATPDDPRTLKNVDIEFQNGVGMQLLITNRNEYTIYDVTLDTESLDFYGGYAVISATPRGITIDELAPGESGSLSFFTFGLPGVYTITAKISYEIEGRTLTQTSTTTLLVFGFFTFVMNA